MARARQRGTRRVDLVDAAHQALLKHGATVQLRQVADEAGITSGAVLYHYPDLQDLLIEANRAGMERFYEARQAAVANLDDPAERLVTTILSGLPTDGDDPDVRLLCELGGAAGRNTVYAALLTALYDRQVALYQVILETGAAQHAFRLADASLTVARNLVALEDAYGYRMTARHPALDHATASKLILDYARLATGHSLPVPDTHQEARP